MSSAHPAAAPLRIFPGQALSPEQDGQWVLAEGTITFVGRGNSALKLNLSSGTSSMQLEVADSSGGAPQLFLNSRVRVSGISKGTFNTEGQRVAGILQVPTLKEIELLEPSADLWNDCPVQSIAALAQAPASGSQQMLVHVRGKARACQAGESLLVEDDTGRILVETRQASPKSAAVPVEALGRLAPAGTNLVLKSGYYRELPHPSTDSPTSLPLLTTIEQIKSLSREEIQRGYPVRIRGVVTALAGEGCFIQDAMNSIHVRLQNLQLPEPMREGDYWEMEGITFPQFAPSIEARRVQRLGPGIMPEPLHPTWDQVLNGSIDTRYIELKGVIITVSSNHVDLLTPAGKIKLFTTLYSTLYEHDENALVRLRGCAIPGRDNDTFRIQSDHLWLCNASISIDEPAPADPFVAPLKRVSDLLLFDPHASALKRVRIAGQILHQQGDLYYLREGSNGLRFAPRRPAEGASHAGDTVEVVGYPDLSGPCPILREAIVRRTGHSPLPQAPALSEETALNRGNDATLVRLQARLIDIASEQSGQVLSLQAGTHGFVARLNSSQGRLPRLLPGSLLELSGVYVGQGGESPFSPRVSSFELLLNSPANVRVLARPDWWTLRRLLAALGIIALVLVGAMLWALTLKRQVNAQSKVIRQKVEREATLEERARIAREIHDTLEQALAGTSLQLDALAGSLQSVPAEAKTILEMARSMVRHAQEEARRTVRNLRLLALEKNDLPNALAQVTASGEGGTGAGIQVSVTGVPRPLPGPVENHLLRIGQEATTNALKHAKAKAIRLELEFAAESIQLTVRDDGCGFDAAHAVPTEAGHFGLLGMRERAEKIGGTLQITSQPGHGTVIQVKVPLGQPGPGSAYSETFAKN